MKEGAALGGAGALLNRMFATRTYGLMDRLPDTALSDYLSGLLIGAEVAESASIGPTGHKTNLFNRNQQLVCGRLSYNPLRRFNRYG